MEVHGELKGALLERVDVLPSPVKQNGHKVFLTTDLKEYKAKNGVYIALKDEQTDDPNTNYKEWKHITTLSPDSISSVDVILTHGEHRLSVSALGGLGGESSWSTGSSDISIGGGGGGGGAIALYAIRIPEGSSHLLRASTADDVTFSYKLYSDETATTAIAEIVTTEGKAGTDGIVSTGVLGLGGEGATVQLSAIGAPMYSSPVGLILNVNGIGCEVVYQYQGADGGDGGAFRYTAVGSNTQSRAAKKGIALTSDTFVKSGGGSDPLDWASPTTPVQGEAGRGYANGMQVIKLGGVLDV